MVNPVSQDFRGRLTRLRNHRDLVKNCRINAVNKIKGQLPDLGKITTIDNTSVDYFSNPMREPRSDTEADRGYRNSAKSKYGKQVLLFGYKMHMIADGEHGIPLSRKLLNS